MKCALSSSRTRLFTFLSGQKNKGLSIRNERKLTLISKFTRIERTQKTEWRFEYDEKCVINLSDVEVPKDVKMLLSLGPKMSINYKYNEVPWIDFLADVENFISRNVAPEERDQARAESVYLMSRFGKKTRHVEAAQKHIQEAVIKTIWFMKEHKELCFMTSDKGNNTVVMKRDDYESKVMNMLLDNRTYEPEGKDRTVTLKNKNNTFVKYLKDNDFIDKVERHQLTSKCIKPPSLYCLPKIHKQDIPMRPIVSTINAPHSALSKWLANIINNIVEKDHYNVPNSYVLKERLVNIRLRRNEVLVSFDVVSLFTSIPLQMVLEIVKNRWNDLERFTEVPYRNFMDMLEFCIIDCNYFSFMGSFYKQKDGLPMGSPLAPVLACLVMDKLLVDVKGSIRGKAKVLAKYVDDLLLTIDKQHIDEVLTVFNSFHTSIKFTHELEANKSIPYLDLRLGRHLDRITFDWFYKPINSGRMLNYVSHHPFHMKLNVAKSLFRRVLVLSDKPNHHNNIEIVRNLLRKNNYPENLIQKWGSEMINCLGEREERGISDNNVSNISENNNIGENSMENINRGNQNNENDIMYYAGISYVQGMSESLQKQLSSKNKEVGIAHRNNNSLKGIYNKVKERIPKMKRSDLVYKIPCAGGGGKPV